MHFRSKVFMAALVGMGLIVSSASAASLTYILDLRVPGVAELYADVSDGDNGGLAAYGVGLSGSFQTADSVSPVIIRTPDFSPAGFNVFRDPTVTENPKLAVVNPFISGSQDAIGGPAANLVYGMGQESSSWVDKGIGVAFANDATADIAWGAVSLPGFDNPIRLALLTYDLLGGIPAFDEDNQNNAGNVWGATSGNTTIGPEIFYQVIIPEPATVTLLGLAAVGFLGFRRRR